LRFWDSSAIVPLLVAETASKRLIRLLDTERQFVVWWGTPIECTSAIARRERDGALPSAAANAAFERLRALQPSWVEVNPSTKVRDIAIRLLRTHPLRASDSFQLAAALVAADDTPPALGFVCLDGRLSEAAQREGFTVTA
jgi:predicted nucleic acid-binding protein